MTRLALTAAAKGIHLGQQLDPGYPGYWTAECADIEGPIDVARLADAVAATVVSAEALHARFPDDRTQVVEVDHAWRPEMVELPNDDWPTVRTMINQRLSIAADVTAGPLFGSTLFIGHGKVYWFFKAHHIVLDGFGYALLYRQVTRRYHGQDVEQFGPLSHIVDDDENYRRSDKSERDRRYWSQRLAEVTPSGFSAQTALPQPTTLSQPIPASILDGAGAAWPHRLLALVAATLHRRTGTGTAVLGLPVSGRLGTPAANVPGMVMNIAPLPVDIDITDTVDDVTANVAAALKESRRHQRYRYEWLRGDLDLPAGSGRVFGPVVNIIPFAEPPEFDGCRLTMRHVSAGPVDDIAVTARGRDSLMLEANPALYSATELSAIVEELVGLAGDTGRVSCWNVIEGPTVPQSTFLPTLIGGHDARAVAVRDGETTLTYGQLRHRAAQIAAQLSATGVKAGDLVAIAEHRSAETIAAMLGVLYAGATYLPLDPDGASQRNAAICAEAQPVAVIGTAPAKGLVTVDTRHSLGADVDSFAAVWDPGTAAYVIYTSGSTGQPKGVSVPRSALDFFVASAGGRYGFAPLDRVLQFAPLHFDAHVEEIFVSLARGSTIVVRDDSATVSLERFTRFVSDNAITVLDLPTAYWHELVLAMHHQTVKLPESVSTVIIGGEAAIGQRVRQWHAAVGDRVRLINTYGPTEATVVCVAADLEPGGAVTLGSPLPGVKVAVGPGQELYLNGPGLASGYLGDTPDTPFITVGDDRWYRTGDLVDVADGQRLDYRGRRDEELKISGHRLHPAEIETALLDHPDVHEAVVTVERSRGIRVIAHVAGQATTEGLRAHAQSRLPQPAIPSTFVVHDRLPRTPNGKIDRRGLHVPGGETTVKARNETERIIVDVFAEVLGHPPAGLEADFFATGGTSLSAVAVAARLSAEFGREVTAADLFSHTTVEQLASVLSGEVTVTPVEELMRVDRQWRNITAPATATGSAAITVTGATGFVGAHLLAELTASTDSELRCLVRGGADRLRRTAEQYGLPDPDFSRITVLEADLARADLGLDAHAKSLVADSKAIVNCAALVSFTRGYRGLREVNIEAVRSLLELAAGTGTAFHQISTVSVGSGNELAEDFVEHHRGLTDGYQRTKWVAEDLVRQAGEAGLSVACYRLGRVVPPAGSGIHNREDFVAHLVRAGMNLGSLPQLDIAEPWIAADVAASCVAQAVGYQHTGVWNMPGKSVRLLDAWQRLLGEHPDLTVLAVPQWRQQLGTDSSTAIMKSFFEVHRDGPPRDHRIQDERFQRWLAEAGPGADRLAPLDWINVIARNPEYG